MLNWKSLKKILGRRAMQQPDGVVGLGRYEEGLAICHVVKGDEGQWTVVDVDFVDLVEEQAQIEYARDWVRDRKLPNADCHYVLTPKEYELLLLEAPAVEQDELLGAATWRIKDLIREPIEDMAVDVMPLPADAYRGRQNMIYGVVAKKETVRAQIDFIKACELMPEMIDIPEMAMRNLISLMPGASIGSVATLGLRRSSGVMVVYSENAMYLSRQIEMGIKEFQTGEPGGLSLDNGAILERLTLDIQRSSDYYESQVGKGVIKCIYVLPLTDESVHITDDVRAFVHTGVESFNIYSLVGLTLEKNLTPREQAYCLPIIGGAICMEASTLAEN